MADKQSHLFSGMQVDPHCPTPIIRRHMDATACPVAHLLMSCMLG